MRATVPTARPTSRAAALLVAALAAGCGTSSSGPTDPVSTISAPANLAASGATVLGEGQLHVTWDAVTGATGYRVSYESGSVTSRSPFVLVVDPVADLGRLAPGRTYQVAVASVDAAGTGPRSASVPVALEAPPAAPTQVRVVDLYSLEGVLDRVRVTWTASVDAPPSYLVFRSADGGVTWTERGSTPDTSFDDPLPVDDLCTRLRYRIAAAKPLASSARSGDEALRGTLLSSSTSTAEFDTVPAASPYVAQGPVSIDATFFRVQPHTLLCLNPGSALSIADGVNVLIYGMLRAVGTPTDPVAITGHAPGGGPAVGGYFLGLSVHPDDTVSSNFDPATGRGSLLDHVSMTALPGLSFNTRPRVHQSKFTAIEDGRALSFGFGGAEVTDCTFDGFFVAVSGAFAAVPSFAVQRNDFRTGLAFPLNLGSNGSPNTDPAGIVAPGQITGNAFSSGLVGGVGFTVSGDLPLGGNYWGGEAPRLSIADGTLPVGVTVTATFDPVLATPPAVGATW